MTFRSFGIVCLLLCLGVVVSVPASARPRLISPSASKVEEQQDDNKQWEKEAASRESSLIRIADSYYKAKDYRKAGDYYERVVGLRYKQWDFPGTGDSIRPAYKTKSAKLDTSNTRRARDRLEEIGDQIKAQDEAETKKDIATLFEDAELELRLGNQTKAFAIYAKVIRIAEEVGKEKFAIDAAFKAKGEQDKILNEVAKELSTIQKLLDAKKPDEAAKALKAYVEANRSMLVVSPKLLAQVQKLSGAPVFASFERTTRSELQLAMADEAFERGQYVLARRHYRSVYEKYPETPAAHAAEEKLALMIQDPEIEATLAKQEAGDICAPLLARARALVEHGRSLEAIIIAEKIMADYKGTKWADEASNLLETILCDMSPKENGEPSDTPEDADKPESESDNAAESLSEADDTAESEDTSDEADESEGKTDEATESEDTSDDAAKTDTSGNSSEVSESSKE